MSLFRSSFHTDKNSRYCIIHLFFRSWTSFPFLVTFCWTSGFHLMTLTMWSHQHENITKFSWEWEKRSHVTKGNTIFQGPSFFLVSIPEISGVQCGRNSSCSTFCSKHRKRDVKFCSRNPSYLKPMHTIPLDMVRWVDLSCWMFQRCSCEFMLPTIGLKYRLANGLWWLIVD